MHRDEFRDAVFARDGGACVVPWCNHYAVDAHHLMERRLWSDGGYHPDNGVSLCNGHHKEAELCLLSPDELRKWAGIRKLILPPELDSDHEHDKWGRIKYPRTYHFPWSPGAMADDKVLKTASSFYGQEVVLTEKMDGENTTIRSDGTHARSLDTGYHPTRTWVRNLAGKIGYEIPDGWRICGENLQGTHAIKYTGLPSFFLVFSIWDDKNVCLSWDDTMAYCDMLGLHTVPLLDRHVYNLDDEPWTIEDFDGGTYGEMEGYVLRLARSFRYDEFGSAVAKYVRWGHIDPASRHWTSGETQYNELRKVT